MPEGDTIWRAAKQLAAALTGKRIADVEPRAFARLKGTAVTEVKPVGKHLVIRFDSGLAIHSHMRMQGVWQVYRHGETWRRPRWQMKARLETEDGTEAVCFSAPIVELIRDEEPRLGHLGPDILKDSWTADEALINARKQSDKAIGELLLDQRVTAGIGNVYRCEALWHQRLNPWTETANLTDAQIKDVYETAREAMSSNLRTDTHARRFPGYGRGAVHGRAGRPCPRCGTPIKVKAQGEHARLTYWCPRCQPSA